jgi:sporulation protein YlmC with PRC-barrel domain
MATHYDTPAIRRFERLGHLGDHRVAKGMLDPRGWKVTDSNGHVVGEVKDLIVDTDRMVAEFIDVELDTKFFALRGDPHVLVPMTQTHRDGDARRLIVRELTRSRVGALLLARDERQIAFWREWWGSRDTLDEPIDPVPPTYTPEPVEPARIKDI